MADQLHAHPLDVYAEGSLEWRAGEKTEDELLQRIWNLATDSQVRGRRVRDLEAALREKDEGLSVAMALLEDEGYDDDPDYRREWKTITDAVLAGESAGEPTCPTCGELASAGHRNAKGECSDAIHSTSSPERSER